MITDEQRTAALTGPWQAILSDHGEVLNIAEVREYDVESLYDMRISIVRGSALPTQAHPDDPQQMPPSSDGGDIVIEWEYFEEYDEIETRWVQAEAMAAGLNAAGAR
ncbi:hypothetical protein ACFFX1_55515 [Dactylosporangium sucinum]|uniref:Uncharacterized protein n=1 Tax=Dactylosporangium sucinum TaxID=1424081 RepID=A0A917X1K6_9ACTN|nr:hypothetical protein [Dactylosporangium sucinum]GGM52558.1 hypothetical protein GCM10007977_062610 [Dactylosporangium sucinum]